MPGAQSFVVCCVCRWEGVSKGRLVEGLSGWLEGGEGDDRESQTVGRMLRTGRAGMRVSSVAACVSVSVSELEADRIVPVDSNRMGVPVCCDARDGIGKERLQAHNQPCFSMHRKPGSQQTRCPASSVLGTDKWSAEGVVVWWRGSGQEQERLMHDAAGISNEALGVWFRFREMMGLVRAQFKGARWWVVRACPAAAQLVVLPSPCVGCVSACVPKDKGTRARFGLDCPGAWVPGCLGVPRWAAACSGSAFSGSGLEPQKPNQTIELISQIGGPPGQIRPFLSSTNHLPALIR